VVAAACAVVTPVAAGATPAGSGAPAVAAPSTKDLATAAERRWATSPEVTAEVTGTRKPAARTLATGMRGRIVDAAYWYRNYGTPYVWSSGWLPCNRNAADCECLNRLAYWDGGWGQLTYTLQGQANTGRYTSNPRPGDLVFWDYDGDGWFGPYDHTGVYVGNGYAIHASAYWGYVVRTTVRVVSAEARGTYYVTIVG
jgi:cell wall-associated NlpC family hydrolase